MPANKITTHAFGEKANLESAVSGGTVNEYDEVFLTDTDELAYINANKQVKMVTPRTQEAITIMGSKFGALNVGDTIPAGTSLEEALRLLTQVRVPATYTQPTISIANNGGTPSPGTVEAGTTITPKVKATFTKNDAGALTQIEILKGGSPIDGAVYSGTGGNTESYDYEPEVFMIGDETVSFSARATYSEGAIKDDNLGDPSPNGHITAGSKTSAVISYIGSRYTYWMFGSGQANYTTSDQVKAMTNKALNYTATNKAVQAPIGTQYIAFAIPTGKSLTKCFVTQMNADIAGSFTSSSVDVADARGGENGLKAYTVYIYQMATALESPWDITYSIG